MMNRSFVHRALRLSKAFTRPSLGPWRTLASTPNSPFASKAEPASAPPTQADRPAIAGYDLFGAQKSDNVSVRIDSLLRNGFVINGVRVRSPVALFGKMFFLWEVQSAHDITPAHLQAFTSVRPVPELLLIGTGDKIEEIKPDVRKMLKSVGIKLEVLDSRRAASTFNFLAEEGRRVAAALIPPTSLPSK